MAPMIPGQVLAARYELREPIGRGGMGEVWIGYDLVLHREVALKVLDTSGTPDSDAAGRFRHEATAAAALTHPHVVTIHDAGIEDHVAYLVMELLPGPTVADLLRERGRLPVDLAVGLARQAAEGLAAVHRVGVVHRDVKPSNLMLDGHDRLKVVDFGIARLVEATTSQITATGTVVGSAAFLSPEQAQGDPATPASDQYALGCVLMAMLTGEPPFAAEHPMGLLRKHLSAPPPLVSDRLPDAPAPVVEIVNSLLSKNPEARSTGFAALLNSSSPPPSQPAATAVLPAAAAESPPAEQGPTAVLPTADVEPARGRLGLRRRRAALLAIAGTVLALIAIAVLPVLIGGDDNSPRDATSGPAAATSTAPQPQEPTPSQTAGGPVDLASAVDSLDATLAQMLQAGSIDEKAAEDLEHQVSDLRKWVDEGKTQDLDKKLDDLDKKIDEQQSKGELDATSAARLQQAVDDIRAAA
jgi:hypothetical protein